MKLNREEVLHIARLARVDLTEAEITRFSGQLSELLESNRHFLAALTAGQIEL